MKNIFLFLVSALSIYTTALSGVGENTVDLRSISHTLVDLVRKPLSIEDLARDDVHDDTGRRAHSDYLTKQAGENIVHDKSKLALVQTGDNIQVSDTERGTTIWNRKLQGTITASWDETGEKLVVWCEGPERIIYRVSYESILQQLDITQLTFLSYCNQHWTKTKKPFVVNDAFYKEYQNLPSELQLDSLFALSDAARNQVRRDYYMSWAMMPVVAARHLISCCRER